MATTKARVPLESGDRLTRAEFHRRYCERPDIRRAELVNGVVYVASPTRFEVHGKQHGALSAWAGTYAFHTPGVRFGDNATVFLTDDGEVQPDVLLFRELRASTSVRLTPDGYLEGAPEFVAEVAASSASYDLHDKMEMYRRAGVLEYVVWRVFDGALDWFELRDGAYVRREPDADGVIESRVFPGLRLPVGALLAGDYAAVLAAVGR